MDQLKIFDAVLNIPPFNQCFIGWIVRYVKLRSYVAHQIESIVNNVVHCKR